VKRILILAAIMVSAAFSAQAQDAANASDPTSQYPVAGVAPANQPQEVVKETHGDWEIRCTNAGATCFMYQLLLNDQGTPVAEMSLVKLPLGSEAVAGVTIVAPLGTLLTRGITMQIDDGANAQYPFSWCTRPGCFSRFGLTDLLLNGMKKGTKVNITVFSIADAQTPVAVSASLKGFTAAFDALEAPKN